MTAGSSHVLPSVGFDQADQVGDLHCLLVYRRCVAVRYEAVEFAGLGVGFDLAVPAIIVDGLKAVERGRVEDKLKLVPTGSGRFEGRRTGKGEDKPKLVPTGSGQRSEGRRTGEGGGQAEAYLYEIDSGEVRAMSEVTAGLILSNPKVMMGKPVIRGTRITVELILEKFAAGLTEEEILRAHPHITREGIRAAREFNESTA